MNFIAMVKEEKTKTFSSLHHSCLEVGQGAFSGRGDLARYEDWPGQGAKSLPTILLHYYIIAITTVGHMW